MKRRSKTKIFLSISFSASRWRGGGEETREKCKEIFWFLHTRVRERVRGALVRFTTQSERTERFRATTRSARAISRHSDCFGKKFGFCSGDTAKSSATLSHEFVKGFERSRRIP